MEMIIEEMGTCKISVEIIAETHRSRNFNRNYSSDRSRSRERRLSPRRYNNNRQNVNSRFRPRSRSRSNSRVRTNRDRIRCYRCQEYDHYVNECQNAITSDSEGHGLDNAALQIWPQI